MIADAEKYHHRLFFIIVMVIKSFFMNISAVAVRETECVYDASVRTLPEMEVIGRKIRLFKTVVGTLIDIIIDSRFFKKLRKHTVMTERVNIISCLYIETEVFFKEFLRIKQMAAESFA